ncbi:enoyl-CoA hydratase/isomerase family protein [Roseateles asaccharophilus]|uniref:Enoyl-CoA hydratase/carnithine racemase n=1 Tax=Roseateles asaccharophilus TaxID=582607 RepID=A0ABU2ABN8_9BURK|nr:enoyl-CoA hydratase/isomerase family protein [Roseateles asaccharophilus]MDR7334604.1 enoyl-CoA hydratase/carnithine racemase [Roseateles asaccharophilus]
MSDLIPPLVSDGQILAQVNGCLGLITLNRPQALNALSLVMIRDMAALLSHWATRPEIQAVAVLGAGREGKAPAFCAGGDIRFFHQAAHAGDTALDDFFTEEYRLNHQIHAYPKPYIALMDGIVMGGGMGISQGAKLRVLSDRSQLAMPETGIGLFPDVGGGYFLSRCPGHVGEWLALAGQTIAAGDAIEWGLGDVYVSTDNWDSLVTALCNSPQPSAEHVVATIMERADLAPTADPKAVAERIDRHFGLPTLSAILDSLKHADDPWAQETHAALLKRSPTMLAVTLELVRRGRALSLADDLRLERDLVHHAFHLRGAARSETVEGIRALAIDKDHAPRWQPAEIDSAEVAAFFTSPWELDSHPLKDLA